MKVVFQPNALPALIGSLPIGDHDRAQKLIQEYTPDIPLWAQLPVYREEGMIRQFLPGLPGFIHLDDEYAVDAGSENFNDELLRFYEEYMEIAEGGGNLENSRFALYPDTAKGFFVLLDYLKKRAEKPVAAKGQITGPITFTTAVKDESQRAIYYDDQLRDAAVKLIGLKARWQAATFKKHGFFPIVFFDEPALAGFGTSEFISMSKEDVAACFDEVIEQVHAEKALAGIHVCANSDWSLLLNSRVDIISFDAYAYFEKFMLYKDGVRNFLENGRIIAWGIVPTMEPELIEAETTDTLMELWEKQADTLTAAGIPKEKLVKQILITPSCGTGSLSIEHATRVMELTRDLSKRIRQTYLKD